jgi:hypothetical protein
MKAAGIVVTLMSSAVLWQGVSFAAPSALPEQQATSPSDRPYDGRESIPPGGKRKWPGPKQLEGKQDGRRAPEKDEAGMQTSPAHAQGGVRESHDRKEQGNVFKQTSEEKAAKLHSGENRGKGLSSDQGSTRNAHSTQNAQIAGMRHRPGQDRPQTVQERREQLGRERSARAQSLNPSTSSRDRASLGGSPGPKGAMSMNKPHAPAALPVRVGSAVPSPPHALHPRGPAPAIVGGAVSPGSRDTAAISGTGMSHRF